MGKIYQFDKMDPKGPLTWFKKICSIPHGSGYEKPLCDFLAKELEKAGCKIVRRFQTGAFLASVKATKGYEKAPCTLLEAHTDMVLAQEEGLRLDLTKEAITPFYDTTKKWLKAEGTTLGADNGIAVAMFMEVATNPKIEHGPLEILFTTGEETDASVCMNQIPKGIFKSKQIINLDTDKETNIYFASAGCVKLDIDKHFNYVPVKKGTKTYNIQFKEFFGGHSGLEIHYNHINAITFLANAFREFVKTHDICLVSMKAGIASNVIPKFITCDIQMDPKHLKDLKAELAKRLDTALVISQFHDKDVKWEVKQVETAKKCLSLAQSKELYGCMSVIQTGAFNYSLKGDCMYNSANFGAVKLFDGDLFMSLSTRSFVQQDAIDIRCKIIDIIKHYGFTEKNIHRKEGCGAWLVREPDKSPLIQLWKKNYIKVWGKQPKITPCAGGLEIAEIVEKAPAMSLNSLSAGPRIWAEHTPNESCPLDTIQNLWKVLTLTLKGMKK